MSEKIESLIRSLPLWKENIKISKIDGGLTNQNFMVEENKKKFVVRMGEDIPEHLISRSNELIVSRAASAVGLSPGIAYHDKGILILEYIKSKTFTDEDVRKNIKSIIPLIKKIHYEIPKKLFGQSLIFWVFHVIRNYVNFLSKNESSHSKILFDLMKKSEILEKKSSPFDIVFGHNDLLPANFLDDGSRLWIIDWEYAGYNSPLFDLGGLSSNNNFSFDEEIYLLENYFEKKISDQILLKYNSLKCASLLRETMWSMVSEITSKIDFDYKNYTEENLIKFNNEFKKLDL
tara:strand:- start:42 stop:911 length:870 start_codon:yes stop_codon:yes gene_type:complete